MYILFFNVSEMIVDFIYKFQIDTTIKLLALILKSCIKSDSFKSFLFVECNWIDWNHLNSYSHSVASSDFRQLKTAGELTVTLKTKSLSWNTYNCDTLFKYQTYKTTKSSSVVFRTQEQIYSKQTAGPSYNKMIELVKQKLNSKKVWIVG